MFSGESSGVVELNKELVEEGMEFVDIEVATAVVVVLIKHLVDKHSQHAVVQALAHHKQISFIKTYRSYAIPHASHRITGS